MTIAAPLPRYIYITGYAAKDDFCVYGELKNCHGNDDDDKNDNDDHYGHGDGDYDDDDDRGWDHILPYGGPLITKLPNFVCMEEGYFNYDSADNYITKEMTLSLVSNKYERKKCLKAMVFCTPYMKPIYIYLDSCCDNSITE